MVIKNMEGNMKGKEVVIALLLIYAKGWRFVNVRKLAKALGISTRKAAKIIMMLESLGIIRRWRDRVGRFKVYVVTSVPNININNKTHT